MPTTQRLRQLFIYNPDTGQLYRRTSAGGQKAGVQAGHNRPGNNHTVIRIDDRLQLAHRVIWTMVNGPIPKGKILDHQDGNTYNNRLANLRLTTYQGNGRNCRLSKNNKSGQLGVYFEKRNRKWAAEIWVGKMKHWLGSYLDKEDAVIARKSAEAKYHFHANHGAIRPPIERPQQSRRGLALISAVR